MVTNNGIYMAHADEPATELSLGIQEHLDGFAEFIQNCETPMTVAIQGDWGTGKTTAMQYIARRLKPDEPEGKPGKHDKARGGSVSNSPQENNIVLEFNTWQYSQFNLGEDLALSLLEAVYLALEEKCGQPNTGDKLKKLLTSFRHSTAMFHRFCSGPILKTVAAYIKSDGLGALLDSIQQLLDGMESSADTSPVKRLIDLRNEFSGYIEQIAAGGKKGQTANTEPKTVYILIDDLDRLNPARAVEVMEALKIFLNVKHCVFVLAIDFSVVLRGVREKYGDDFDEEKARSFFDKIIQIPFNLPVAAYELDSYVEACLPDAISKDAETINHYVKYLEYSIGNNPRSIKRIFNTFMLVMMISNANEADDGGPAPIDIFAMLCFQKEYSKLFDDVMEEMHAGRSVSSYLKELLSIFNNDRYNASDYRNWFIARMDEWGYTRGKKKRLALLLQAVCDDFGILGSEKDSENRLRSALEYAALTSIHSSVESGQSSEDELGEKTKKLTADERKNLYQNNDRFSDFPKDLLLCFEEELQKNGLNLYANWQIPSSKMAYYQVAADDSGDVASNTEQLLFGGKQFLTVRMSKKHLRVIFGVPFVTYKATSGQKEEAEEKRKSWMAEIRKAFSDSGQRIEVTASQHIFENEPIFINKINTEEQIKTLVEVLARMSECNGRGGDR